MLDGRATLVLLSLATVSITGGAVTGDVAERDAHAAVRNVAYEMAFDRTLAAARTVRIAMMFDIDAPDEIALSLPAWTPGAWRIGNFARNVRDFRVESSDGPIEWDRLDPDTWRLRVRSPGRVRIDFAFLADTLDNAMAWSRPDFLFVNGTNVFPYFEGRSFDFAATVTVRTEPDWRIATGMSAGARPGEWMESSYHDLVDMPWFIGDFDLDSMRIDGRWHRLATYPAEVLKAPVRQEFWKRLERIVPVQAAVFGETPWQTYTTMLIFDADLAGGSALEHRNSHVGVYGTLMLGSLALPLVTAHELFHAWNAARMRPVDLVPWRYDRAQPTAWLWMSEGITDYYADLTLVRSGVAPDGAFYALTGGKITMVAQAPPVALEDASLAVWIAPRDGTSGIHYAKGSLAGLMLDILIRDASDNRRSLDDVMRELYHAARSTGGGFTGDDWWGAIERASGGRSFDDFRARYIDGRPPYPWPDLLPLAGMRLVADTMREARIGVTLRQDGGGVHVQAVAEGGMAALGGVRPGDRMLSVGDVPVKDLSFGEAYRTRYSRLADGTPVTIKVERDGRWLALEAPLRIIARVEARVEPDPSAAERAARIRDGILTGRVDTR